MQLDTGCVAQATPKTYDWPSASAGLPTFAVSSLTFKDFRLLNHKLFQYS